MKKFLKDKGFTIFLVILALGIFALYYFSRPKEPINDEKYYNVANGKRVSLIEKPCNYDENDILTLLDGKCFELASNYEEMAYFKLLFISDDGDFKGEYLDKKDGVEIFSNFKGKFHVIEKLDDLTYRIEVEDMKLRDGGFSDYDMGEENLIYVFPNHFRNKNQFILRLPNNKTYDLIDGYEKYDFQYLTTDTLNVFTLETGAMFITKR